MGVNKRGALYCCCPDFLQLHHVVIFFFWFFACPDNKVAILAAAHHLSLHFFHKHTESRRLIAGGNDTMSGCEYIANLHGRYAAVLFQVYVVLLVLVVVVVRAVVRNYLVSSLEFKVPLVQGRTVSFRQEKSLV